MEARRVNEYHIFSLSLERITDESGEQICIVISDDRLRLAEWYENLRTAPYEEEIPGEGLQKKYFKKGSQLEFFRPAASLSDSIQEAWINQEALDYFKRYKYCLFSNLTELAHTTPECFLEQCSDAELKKTLLLLNSKRYATRINLSRSDKVEYSLVDVAKEMEAYNDKKGTEKQLDVRHHCI